MKPQFASCLALFTLLLAFAASATAPTTPAAFSPPDQLFTLLFPGKPSAREDSLPSATGAPYKRMTYVYEGRSSMLLAGVLYTGRDSDNAPEEQLALLENTLMSLGRGMPGLVLDAEGGTTDVRIGKYPGKQLKGTANGMGFYCRIFVGPRHLFLVQGLYDPQNKAAETATLAAVNSFAPR